MQGLHQLMFAITARLASRHERERGATAVEYGLIVALIAGIVIASVAFLGTRTQAGFNSVTVNYPG